MYAHKIHIINKFSCAQKLPQTELLDDVMRSTNLLTYSTNLVDALKCVRCLYTDDWSFF